MERHKCKLCSRKFINGKALGGHMRSHLATLPIPPKTHQLSDRTESAPIFSSPSSSSEEEEEEEEEIIQEPEQEEEEEKGLVYGLRENPKRSFRVADPEFSFTVDAGFVVQDGESETESRNPTRKRSKRNRRVVLVQNQVEEKKNAKLRNLSKPSLAESQVSSVSDTSPDEDVAMCLMMLSRDIWVKSNDNKLCCEKHKCETCNKVFPTFQALGGHRASHKKMRSNNNFQVDQTQTGESSHKNNKKKRSKNNFVLVEDHSGESRNGGKFIAGTVAVANAKVHECPFCYKVFGSGQALGGHKRSHFRTSTTPHPPPPTNYASKVFEEDLIDLNLPAPMEDEVSAVSYAE